MAGKTNQEVIEIKIKVVGREIKEISGKNLCYVNNFILAKLHNQIKKKVKQARIELNRKQRIEQDKKKKEEEKVEAVKDQQPLPDAVQEEQSLTEGGKEIEEKVSVEELMKGVVTSNKQSEDK